MKSTINSIKLLIKILWNISNRNQKLKTVFIVILSGINFAPVNKVKSFLNELIYRSSFIVSIPENFVINSYFGIKKYWVS